MAKPEWGMKRGCLNCGAKFYDLQKDPIVCPKCETEFDPEAATKLKRNRGVAPDKASEKTAAPVADDDALLDTDDLDAALDDTAEDVLEDTDDLGGDDVPVVGGANPTNTNDSGDDV
ncbi:TIGR02300 family protein [Curvivirga sp.]|uniref:TIGR02300 family protein n=1 Tax=Curvivirga sp. TaxID=2856848 RepID=UPI003B592BAD